jgi:hypothetical protein
MFGVVYEAADATSGSTIDDPTITIISIFAAIFLENI